MLFCLMWLTPLKCWLGRGDMQREEQVPWAPADHWHWGCPALLIVKGESMSLKAPRSQMLALAGGPCATQVQRQLCHPDGLVTKLQNLRRAVSKALIQTRLNTHVCPSDGLTGMCH